ncbi:MAG TPA: sn-glycerol-3-phosphate ABC transporter ATP-binding protein UgpC [Acetobacteraceae bacterium]|jgi:sn-glycerol 3-phosphate transport system ATP-binding protein|nr:sn-glycerol-3-phosphate ABC transporter ATP-binding protein UgpC [Acetobacteraceae bacterium]
MATLELQGLRKSFGLIDVLEGIDLTLPDGEMLVIVGASGCGKSTLLRLVAGLERPTSGRVVLGGRDVTNLDPSERDIAMVFQNYALYPHMTVFDNMAYGLRIRGLSRDEIRRRVDEAAGLLGIGALLERKPRQLSGGQRQRVAMGRAIVRHPKLFLFDEPLSNLDAKLRLAMRAEIRKLQRRLGVTSLFVTHDQVEAMTLGDRLLVLHQGQPAQLATPMEVFEHPADIYVAGFIGAPTMNFLPAVLAGGGTAAQLEAGPLIPLFDGRRRGTDGHPLIVGIRPEHLEPAPDGFDLLIDLIEPLGSETLVHGHLTGGEEQSLVVRLAGAAPAGERLTVRPQPQYLHVFDRASGKRIDPSGEENRALRLAAAGTAD